jgi:hypothetical protein
VHYVIEAKHFIFVAACIFAALCFCGGILKTVSPLFLAADVPFCGSSPPAGKDERAATRA